jgi:hypothetical protein
MRSFRVITLRSRARRPLRFKLLSIVTANHSRQTANQTEHSRLLFPETSKLNPTGSRCAGSDMLVGLERGFKRAFHRTTKKCPFRVGNSCFRPDSRQNASRAEPRSRRVHLCGNSA